MINQCPSFFVNYNFFSHCGHSQNGRRFIRLSLWSSHLTYSYKWNFGRRIWDKVWYYWELRKDNGSVIVPAYQSKDLELSTWDKLWSYLKSLWKPMGAWELFLERHMKPVEKLIETWGMHREHRRGSWVPRFVVSAPIRLCVHMSILWTTQFSTQPIGYEFLN